MKTIAGGWQTYRDQAVAPSQDVLVRRDIQAAFYAGACFVVDELVDMQGGHTLPDHYAHHLTRWQSEMTRQATRTAREESNE